MSEEKMTVLEYFNGDELAANVWQSKYAMEGEKTPEDMHRRMAKEFARVEKGFPKNYDEKDLLSKMGKMLMISPVAIEGKKGYHDVFSEEWIMQYFDKFGYIVPQGSIMSMLGNKYKVGSLSNCFVIPSPVDSYGGIMKTDERLVQLMKRRGGVGFNLNPLRPTGTAVSNAAGTSTGVPSFAERFSNSTREVAQGGRRGALMLLLHVKHPDIFKFVTMKKDRTKVTGANISSMLTDEFMEAAMNDEDFICTFPVDLKLYGQDIAAMEDEPYNKLVDIGDGQVMRIHARELFDLIVEMAWENAEPGVAFIDRVKAYCPEGVYLKYVPIASNPCGEQWMQAYDACRLLAANLFSLVKNPFSTSAEIDWEKLYEVFYIQQRLGDDIVELELEYIQKIITKINNDKEDVEVKRTELQLWQNIYSMTEASRRTGCGFTGLGDMLAALNLRYDSKEALQTIEKVMREKMRAELDCTIDLGILRGTFEGWDPKKEFCVVNGPTNRFADGHLVGQNEFYNMIIAEYGESMAIRMYEFGRRNVSWSTVAPTGTVSLMTQTTSGLEPLFQAFYMRRKKVNANEKGVRVDFVDQNGDSWQEFAVIHPKFKEWIRLQSEVVYNNIDNLKKEDLQKYFEDSPWYLSTANDIDWEMRVDIQAIIQRYTTNAISSTINLPNNVSKETVYDIYKYAWKKGLKGVTIYRDGCRTGVLVSSTEKKSEGFSYKDAIRRPKSLDADLHVVTAKGIKYAVIVGKLDEKPYEVFAFKAPEEVAKVGSLEGEVVKAKKGHYNFLNGQSDHTLKDIQIIAEEGLEQVVARLASGMLRHGAKPQFVMEQIDKCELPTVEFASAVKRVLKKYVKEEELIARSTCSNCGSTNLRMEEGCVKCLECGQSKCG